MPLEIILPWNLTEITGAEMYHLFLQTYPRIKVYKNTHLPNDDVSSGGIKTACTHCMQPYRVGEEILVLPCSIYHCFHVSCHERYISSHYSLDCPICPGSDPIPPYENLKPAKKAEVWVGYGCNEDEEPIPFAWSESDDWRFNENEAINPYLPWGNHRRYLKQPQGIPSAAPCYEILDIKDRSHASRFPPGIQQDLRTGRPRLCQLPYLKYLKERLQELGSGGQTSEETFELLLKVYLFSDLTNAIFIMNSTLKHIYVQVRIGYGQLAWFGFREYEYYIMNNIPNLLGYERILMGILEFLSSVSMDFEQTLKLHQMVKELKEFDTRVDSVEFESREDTLIMGKKDALAILKPFGETCNEWAYEKQEEVLFSSEDIPEDL
ncbi:hypothetical protein TWF788_003248 [Orbilia oligospora]|uniref:RING-type domain-containing protein n=1 Tax=Orbilia oligospora TaxID=2813651 RepID=A0A7C8U9W4_ORBOL|nr:hypothetical protein TWF788_003248 [Orbilia oligospora]